MGALFESVGNVLVDAMKNAQFSKPLIENPEQYLTQDEKALLYLYRQGKVHRQKKQKKRKKK